MFTSKYGVARHIFINVPKAGSANHAVGADWTPAAGDVKISKDGGAAANVTNLPTAIAMGNSAIWDFSLTATEMQAAQVNITVSDSATKAVDDTGFVIETYGNASAQHAFDLGTASTAQTGDSFARLGAPAGASTAADIAAVKAQTAAIETDTAEIGVAGAGLTAVASAANLATVVGYIDTEVAAILAAVDTEVGAIKTKTDQLTFTIANQVDSNALSGGGGGLDAAGVRAAIGLAAANLDTQLSTIDDFIDTEIADIRSRIPAALVGGRMDVTVSAIDGDTTALAAFKAAVRTNVTGTVGAASSTTSVVTSSLSPAASVSDQFKGLIIKFDLNTSTAALRGQASDITASTAGGVLTVTALTTAPANGDTFAIL